MKKKSLYRHTNISLNLTPHYKKNKFAGGGKFDNLTSAGLWDDSTKATLNNTGGAGSVSGVFAGVEGMLDAGLSNAKLASTYNMQSEIADNFGQALGNQNLNTNDSLMEAWDQYSPMSHVHYHDIRGGSTFGRIWNTNMASIKGAEAGWNTGAGPWGAIIGGVVGLGAGIGGWLAGDKKAARLKRQLNQEIDIANEFGYENLAHQQANVEQKNLLRAEGNYVAYGGPLDKRLAGHQMQNLYSNGIPSANKFSGGGNAFIALEGNTPQQTAPMEEAQQEKSVIDTLLPYIMRAKAQREEKERLEAQRREELSYAERYRQWLEAQQVQQQVQQQISTPQVIQQETTQYSPENLYESIANLEGFLETPQWDVDGYAIGYGDHNKELVDYYLTHKGEKYTKEEGKKQLRQTVDSVRKILAENIPGWDELTGPQQDALTSYGYNTGPWKLINKSPKLLEGIANKDWDKVVRNINRGWDQVDDKGRPLRGLRKRRNFERLPFLYTDMTQYGVLPDGTVVNPDDLLDVDLSKPYVIENGKWSNSVEPAVLNDTVPVYVNPRAFGGNLFAYGTEDPYAAAGRRYQSARAALLNNGYSSEESSRLAKLLATQAVLESGYKDNSDNNYGGHLDPRNRRRMHYNNEEDFWKAQIDTLNKKWSGWDKAKTLTEYYNTINHADLGLDTLEKFNAYNKAHRGNEVYLYAPEWENEGYLNKLNGIYNRASKYYNDELEIPTFLKMPEQKNNTVINWQNPHFGNGGNLFAYGRKLKK